MIWAELNGERINAQPSIKAICPSCKNEVISKCGSIKMWHFAHKSEKDCDSWSEGETEWHINWKNEFPKEQQEVVVSNHRADIKNNEGVVIELQNSSICLEEIKEREDFYQNLVWLINGKTFAQNLDLRPKDNGIVTFRWKYPPKCWWATKKPLYIDLNPLTNIFRRKKEQHQTDDYFFEAEYKFWEEKENICRENIFLIKRVYSKIPCGGWGRLISKKDFLDKFRGNNGNNS